MRNFFAVPPSSFLSHGRVSKRPLWELPPFLFCPLPLSTTTKTNHAPIPTHTRTLVNVFLSFSLSSTLITNEPYFPPIPHYFSFLTNTHTRAPASPTNTASLARYSSRLYSASEYKRGQRESKLGIAGGVTLSFSLDSVQCVSLLPSVCAWLVASYTYTENHQRTATVSTTGNRTARPNHTAVSVLRLFAGCYMCARVQHMHTRLCALHTHTHIFAHEQGKSETKIDADGRGWRTARKWAKGNFEKTCIVYIPSSRVGVRTCMYIYVYINATL